MPGIGLEKGGWSAVRVAEEMDTEGSCKGKKIEIKMMMSCTLGDKEFDLF
jgi:hypothetical protein